MTTKERWRQAWSWYRESARGGGLALACPLTDPETRWLIHTCAKAYSDLRAPSTNYRQMDLRLKLAAHIENRRDLSLGGAP